MDTLPEFKDILQKDLWEMMFVRNKKNDFLEFADLFELPIKQSYNKKKLAESIEFGLLQHPEVLMNIIPKNELLSLQKLVHSGGYIKTKEPLHFLELKELSIVYQAKPTSDSKNKKNLGYEYVLPGNLQCVLQKTIDAMVKHPYVDVWDRKDHMLIGMLELYGVLSQDQLFKLWKKITGEKLEVLDFLKMLRHRSFVRGLCEPFYYKHSLCLANANVEYPEELYEAVMKRKDLDYCLYSFDDVFISAESYLSIIDDSKYVPLVRMLDELNEGDEMLTSMQMTALWIMDQNGAKTSEIIDFLLKDFSFESLEHANKLIMALTTFTNAMPKWIIKGHTSDELQSKHPLNLNDPLFRKQVVESFAKQFPDEPASAMDGFWNQFDKTDNVVPFTPRPTIGRNDPCPCGSGKKYKKCCGDN